MTLTDEQYQQMIIAEVGDDAQHTLESAVPLYWDRRSGIADLELRYLIVKRDAIVLMLGRLRGSVDLTSGGDSAKMSQAFDHLLSMLAEVDDQIAQASGSAGAAAAAGELTQTAPIMPPFGSLVDANSAAYRGSPYQARRRR
jgi:hypothetical protein